MSQIVPTVMVETIDQLRESTAKLQTFARRVHIDISDGEFAPTFLLNEQQLFWPQGWEVDVHAMVARPSEHIAQLIQLKPSMVIFHSETQEDLVPHFAALKQAGIKTGEVDYINAHATSTPVGDGSEARAIFEVFGGNVPVSSTKSLTGHSQGGRPRGVYSLLMMQSDFVAASANIENLDPGAEGYPIARQRIDNAGLQTVMSNSFGFGGTNACLLFSRYDH